MVRPQRIQKEWTYSHKEADCPFREGIPKM